MAHLHKPPPTALKRVHGLWPHLLLQLTRGLEFLLAQQALWRRQVVMQCCLLIVHACHLWMPIH
jgi:hypothetical protein